MLGKFNMDEFVMGSLNEILVYGNVVNLWCCGNDDVELISGGFFGGLVFVVFVDLCFVVIGIDIGGLIC